MKKIIGIIIVCIIPYVGISQNFYKNSFEKYYNMDTVNNIFTDSINLPVLEIINSKLLKSIDKCVRNYEKKVSSTPDSLGSYFMIYISYQDDLFYFGLTISPEPNFYMSLMYNSMKAFNRSYKELSLNYIQDSYYGCFYYKGYLFIVERVHSANICIFPKLFNISSRNMDIMIYKNLHKGFYRDDDMYTLISHSYEMRVKKNGKIDFDKRRKRK